MGDKAYSSAANRSNPRKRGITAVIVIYRGTIDVASIRIWLRAPVS